MNNYEKGAASILANLGARPYLSPTQQEREAASILANLDNFVPTQQPTQAAPAFVLRNTNEGGANALPIHFMPSLPITITAQGGGINREVIQAAKILANAKNQSRR
jgi:hypothetical protein